MYFYKPNIKKIDDNDISKNNIYSKSYNSPFIGVELKGKIKATIVKGHISQQD